MLKSSKDGISNLLNRRNKMNLMIESNTEERDRNYSLNPQKR